MLSPSIIPLSDEKKSDDEKKRYDEETTSFIKNLRERGKTKLGELENDLYNTDTTTDDEEEEISAGQQFLDDLCILVANKSCDRAQVIEFLKNVNEPDFDINGRDSQDELRPIEHAALSGSLDVLQFLYEDYHASITNDKNYSDSLMMLISIKESDKINYFMQNQLWKKIGNNTTDLHAYVWAGDIVQVKRLVEADPYSILALNDNNESVLDWLALKENNNELWDYIQKTTEKITDDAKSNRDWYKLRDIGYWKGLFYMDHKKESKSIDSFLVALHYHRRAVESNADDNGNENKSADDLMAVSSKDTYEDKVFSMLAKAYSLAGVSIVNYYDPTDHQIQVSETLEDSKIVYSSDRIRTVHYFIGKFNIAIDYQIEAMRTLNSTSEQSESSIEEFKIYRYNLANQYLTLALTYSRVGQMFIDSELYREAAKAYISSEIEVNKALAITKNSAIYPEFSGLFDKMSPRPHLLFVNNVKDILKEVRSKLRFCERKNSKIKRIKLNEKAGSSPSHTLWQAKREIPDVKVQEADTVPALKK